MRVRAAVCGGVLLLGLAAGWPAPAAAQGACAFTLGFATLRGLVGPQTVGDCLENERHNPANGNAEQRTTRGLLAWRKADNWTAFTDGYRTWINGPGGLQQRLNSQRFSWEGDAGAPGTTTIAPAPAPVAAPPLRPVTPGEVLGQCLRQRDGYFLPDQPVPGTYGLIKTGIVNVNICPFPITFISSAKLVRPSTGYVLHESSDADKERVTLGPNEVQRTLHFIWGVFDPPYEIQGYHAVAY